MPSPAIASLSLPHAARRATLALVAAATIALAAPAAAAPNLLANGDMEEAAPGASGLAGWQTWVWYGDGETKATEAVKAAGRRSAQLFGAGHAKQALMQTLTLKPCTYTLAATVASSELQRDQNGQAGALLLLFDKQQAISKPLAEGDTDWRRVELVFNVAAETKVVIYFFNYGAGRLFVDDATLTAASSCAAPAPESFSIAATPLAPLSFRAPPSPADRVLAGYCTAPDFAERPVCRALAEAAAAQPAAKPAAAPATLLLDDFEPPAGSARASIFQGQTLAEGAAAISGRASAQLKAGAYMAALATQGLPSSWAGYDWLRLEVHNPSSTPAVLDTEIWDDKTTGYWSRVNWPSTVPPGRSTIHIPLQVFVGEKTVVQERRRINRHDIRRLVFVAGAVDLLIDNVRLEAEPAYANDFPELIKLDPGPQTGPVFFGFTALDGSHIYAPARGYGLSADAVVAKAEDRRHPDDLLRDWISFTRGGLDFDLPNGRYVVWMMLEDPGYWEYFPNFQRRVVTLQGNPVLDERQADKAFLARYFAHADSEDWPGDDTWARYIATRYRPLDAAAEVTDGKLRIRFGAQANPLALPLSALVIFPQAKEAQGRKFLAELDARRKAAFNREYVEVLPPLPAAPAPAPNALGGKAWAFQRSIALDVAATDWPAAGELSRELRAETAVGSASPIALSIHAGTALDLVGAALSLPGLDVEPLKIRYKLKRLNVEGTAYQSAPLIIDPLRPSAANPVHLAKGRTLTLLFDVRAAKPVAGGEAKGTLRLDFGRAGVHTMPVRVRVHPWQLPEADIPVGYLGFVPAYPETPFPGVEIKRHAEAALSVDLLRSAGMTAASGGFSGPRIVGYRNGSLAMDFKQADFAMDLLKGKFSGPLNTYSGMGLVGIPAYSAGDTSADFGKPYAAVLADALAAIGAHGRERGWLPLEHVVGDEPQGDAIAGSIAAAAAHRSASPPSRTAVFTSFTKSSDPAAALAGAVDHLFLNNHSAAAFDLIRTRGGTCSLYNQTGRYRRGIYLYRIRAAGCLGHMQYAYNAPGADPWYGLDAREDDMGAVVTHSDGLRRTLDFMRYREAVTDYRYLLALEQSVAHAASTVEAERARAWLASLVGQMPVGHDAPSPWPEDRIDEIRMTAARFIDALAASKTPR